MGIFLIIPTSVWIVLGGLYGAFHGFCFQSYLSWIGLGAIPGVVVGALLGGLSGKCWVLLNEYVYNRTEEAEQREREKLSNQELYEKASAPEWYRRKHLFLDELIAREEELYSCVESVVKMASLEVDGYLAWGRYELRYYYPELASLCAQAYLPKGPMKWWMAENDRPLGRATEQEIERLQTTISQLDELSGQIERLGTPGSLEPLMTSLLERELVSNYGEGLQAALRSSIRRAQFSTEERAVLRGRLVHAWRNHSFARSALLCVLGDFHSLETIGELLSLLDDETLELEPHEKESLYLVIREIQVAMSKGSQGGLSLAELESGGKVSLVHGEGGLSVAVAEQTNVPLLPCEP